MGRPRKNSNTPDARRRILDAFWLLLQTHRLREITVGMIVARAGCNRGTFYYHFDDMDALVFSAVEEELLGDTSVAMDIFNMVAGADDDALADILRGRRMERFSLLMRQGGRDAVERSAKTITADMWRAVLCPDGGELSQRTMLLIEYATSGILGVVSYVDRLKQQGQDVEVSLESISQLASHMLSLVAEAEGLSLDEILTRLNILNQFHRASQR